MTDEAKDLQAKMEFAGVLALALLSIVAFFTMLATGALGWFIAWAVSTGIILVLTIVWCVGGKK